MDIWNVIDGMEAPRAVYTFDDLKDVTDNFSPMSFVAKGNHAWVYHAQVTWQEAAVKKLDYSGFGLDSDDDFLAQVNVLFTLQHEHVTRLMGYCMEDDNRYLVYEFGSLGSLHDVLHGRKGIEGAEPGPVLTWAQRAKIAYGAAQGLEYLHQTIDPPIVHGDVRSSNVLLFYDYRSKIADFDLKRAVPDSSTASRTRSPGSYGYNGPECAMTGKMTVKSDVYSFGVILLELLTGRKAVDYALPKGHQSLVSWATPFLSADKVEQIVDPKLNGDFPPKAVAKVAALAELCLQYEPDFRPNMTIMVKGLESLQEEPEEASVVAECEGALKVYTLDELNEATNNFNHMSLIAKNSYASVFRTYYKTGQLTAVKKLDMSNAAQDSDADFAAQLSVVSALKDDNLTELLGYCLEENNRILVYEFATMGSLHDVLYGRKQVSGAEPGPELTWDQRARIAYGAAKGLKYLHETVDPPIVHGGVRSSNVLVFDSLIPGGYYSKIADFNLTNALLGTTRDLGDDLLGKRTRKTDIYDFGVVLLELLTGRKPVDDTLPEEQQDLVTWATPYLTAENVEQIIDVKLNGDFPLEDVIKVSEIAGLCIQDDPDSRPDMSIVAEALET